MSDKTSSKPRPAPVQPKPPKLPPIQHQTVDHPNPKKPADFTKWGDRK